MMKDAPDRSGTALGEYHLERLLGRGGMGEVYVARDDRLGRTVALKILLPEVVQDAERRTRFEREAKALAALRHPGIVTIHSFETVGEDTFFTMELIEGRTLTELMKAEGSMSVARILELGIPIADALAAAHRRGIAHRDIKPENIIVGPRGEITVLDFGLAKLATNVIETPDQGDGVTASLDATVAGRIVGTIHYMAPEQAQGEETNPTTDVFSLGVVLYEMATGLSPFPGETTVSKLSSIIKDDPAPIQEHNAEMPPGLDRVIRRCLAKDPDRRLQNAVDVRNELEILQEELAHPTQGQPATSITSDQGTESRGNRGGLVLAALGGVIGLALGVLLMNPWGESTSTTSDATAVANPQQCISVMGPDGHEILEARIDPAARRIAMVTRQLLSADQNDLDYLPGDRRYLHLRDLDSFENRLVDDSRRIACGEFSPDGKSYIFVKLPSDANLPAKLMRLSLDTDLPPVQIGTIPLGILGYDENFNEVRGFAWLEGDILAFVTDTPYQVVRVDVRNGAELGRTDIEFAKAVQPDQVLAAIDANRFLLSIDYYDERGYIQDTMWVDAMTGENDVVTEGSPIAELIDGNRMLLSRGETLYLADYDPKTRRIDGEATPVFTNLRTTNSWSGGGFDVAGDGTVVHLPGGLQGGRRTLWRIEEDGTSTALETPARAYEEALAVSEDGAQIVITKTNEDNAMWELWSGRLDPPRIRRLISLPAVDVNTPILSRDGTMVAARLTTTQPTRRIDLVFFPIEAPTTYRVLQTEADGQLVPHDLHPGKDRVLYSKQNSSQEMSTLFEIDLVEGSEPRKLADSSGTSPDAAWSPDGRLLAYTSDASGMMEVFVGVVGPDGLENVVRASDGLADTVGWSVDPAGTMRLHYFANGVEHRRDVSLVDGRVRQSAIARTGRVLDDNTMDFELDRSGRIHAIQRGANEAPADRVEVITGRFGEGS
ncbi:MAG: protein kinase [Phycisphaerales bacterium]|nr:protein kinase [Phycisphaerales bacterium]